jgi:hypothetical protein
MATPIDSPDNWYLKKHENGDIFGPVHFNRIREWAQSAQVNSQDMLSDNQIVWTKAPMLPDLKMDWLIVVGQDLLYGPTTEGALLEFFRLGEINAETHLINCCTGESVHFGETIFFQEEQKAPPEDELPATNLPPLQAPAKGNIRFNLQQRVRQLETALMERQRKLIAADDTIMRLEMKIKDLEDKLSATRS